MRPPTPEQKDRNDVVLANLGLTRKVVNRLRAYLSGHRLDVEDALQNGILALLAAAEGYDPSRGRAWATYAYSAILKRVLHTARAQGGVISLPNRSLKDEPEHAQKAARARGAGCIDDPDVRSMIISGRAERDHHDPAPVWAAASRLDDRSRLVLTCRFRARPRLTQQETARLLGCSRELAAKVEYAAVAQLRKMLGVAA